MQQVGGDLGAFAMAVDLISLGEAALESDRRYFELSATIEPLPWALLARVPGLEGIPAGCVVQRVESDSVEHPQLWVQAMTDKASEIGSPQARVYLDGAAPALERALRDDGFRCRTEVAYVFPAPMPARRADVFLRLVSTERDWAAKLALHNDCELGPDGYRTGAEAWVELERRKAGTGQFKVYLIEVGGAVCGSVALLELAGLFRAKNIVVHPSWRRRGIATEALRLLGEMAERHGSTLCIFAVEGHYGEAVYRRVATAAASQTEWVKPLPDRQPTT